MTVKITKPSINVRAELAELRKQSGTAGETMLRAETPQEQFNLIGAGRRNILINGAMRVAQRGTSSTISSVGYFTCDRWLFGRGAGTWNLSQGTSGPTGFSNTFKMQVSATGGLVNNTLQYRLEGQDLQSLSYGTNERKEVTISFWVKTNVTGTYTLELYNQNSLRQISKNYTVNSSGDWEYKTITIPGDPSNGFANNNGSSLLLVWWLSADPSYASGTQNTSAWKAVATGNRVNSAQPNVANTIGNYFEITGVQMELGKAATPFEHRSYGEELAFCQRYYETGTHYSRGYAQDTGSGYCQRNMPDVFKVTKRANPSVSISGIGSLGTNVNLDRVTFSTYTVNAGNAFTVHNYTWTADAEL